MKHFNRASPLLACSSTVAEKTPQIVGGKFRISTIFFRVEESSYPNHRIHPVPKKKISKIYSSSMNLSDEANLEAAKV